MPELLLVPLILLPVLLAEPLMRFRPARRMLTVLIHFVVWANR